MTGRWEGSALLVAGHGAIGGTRLDASVVRTLGQIGETLLATGTSWQIRRLSAAVGERYGADRGSIKHHVDELVAEPVRVALLVVLGVVADASGPALVTSSRLHEYPEDATLPLAWIGERLRACKAEQLVVVMSGRRAPGFGATAAPPATWLDALATGRRADLVAVDASDAGAPVIDALLGGLCGEAIDPRTGTVTMKSLSGHLARATPSAAIAGSQLSQTLASSPPFGILWDVRRTARAKARPSDAATEDLAGSVLPGRFRLDSLIARGSFGTVYRAHQLAVERDVAVKLLHPDIDPLSEDGRLFVQEVRAVGRIDHANVVRIHQADVTSDGRLFYAMELLDGRDLQQLGQVPQDRAVELMRQLLAGLGAAHDAGLVHADVKPANAIVVDRDGADRVVLVDFGLARLRAPDRPSESAGGTPAYMAPEQLSDARVDARSDLFSAALVLVTLLTGWRRASAAAIVPPLDAIADGNLRAVLARALEIDPAKRYQTAHELAGALTGTAVTVSARVTQPMAAMLPFRLFAPLTEADRDRLCGRDADVAALVEHVLYRRSVIYTAPSGTGKTSLLRAALTPRLEELHARVVYVRCRNASAAAVAEAIAPGASSVSDAIAAHVRGRGGKLVVVLDQIEAALGDGDLVTEALGFARWPADADVSVVLSVREDHLARLIARTQRVDPGIPIVRLPPLGLAGARAAIVGPLAEARLAIEPELLDELLADLERAASTLGPEMGWGDVPAVYPPHLQLACSVLYEALAPGEATLTLAHYRVLGGFATIVGEHLERVLDVELADGRDAIARDLFVALVTTAHERAMRVESELVAIVGARHGSDRVVAVLELLRARGLLMRVRGDGEAAWELVHDSLVPRVLAWIDRRDLARRRAVELVRYHLRRSQPRAPSLLGRAELRELRAHDGAIAELEQEWRGRLDAWTPALLVARSRQVLRRRAASIASIISIALSIAAVAVVRNRIASAEKRHEDALRDRDLGRFALELDPFDWDPKALRATPVSRADLPDLRWELHEPDPNDPDSPGALVDDRHFIRGAGDHAEARGGHAFLVIDGRGRNGEHCAPSIVPIANLPGYARRREEQVLRVRVPTCAATRADTVRIPGGTFIFGGAGEPPSADAAAGPPELAEHRVDLRRFGIDRTEVSNAAFQQLTSMVKFTGIATPSYPVTPVLANNAAPRMPVASVTWSEARAFCRFMGKELPTSQQWQKAARGGEQLPNGSVNISPRRNLPWGDRAEPARAQLKPQRIAEVDGTPLDVSPYGVLNLAGNVMEWTDSMTTTRERGIRVARGGDVADTPLEELVEYMAIENPRPEATREFQLGVRCAEPDDDVSR